MAESVFFDLLWALLFLGPVKIGLARFVHCSLSPEAIFLFRHDRPLTTRAEQRMRETKIRWFEFLLLFFFFFALSRQIEISRFHLCGPG